MKQTLATSKRGNIFHVRSVQQSAISAKLIEMGLYVGQEVEILFIKDSVRLARKVENSDREKVKSTVVSVRKQIDERCASGVFEPIKHRLCDWCSFKQICPLWS